MEEITVFARQVSSDGSSDLDPEQVNSFIGERQVKLTVEDSEMEACEIVYRRRCQTVISRFGQVYRLAQNLKYKIFEYDPVIHIFYPLATGMRPSW